MNIIQYKYRSYHKSQQTAIDGSKSSNRRKKVKLARKANLKNRK